MAVWNFCDSGLTVDGSGVEGLGFEFAACYQGHLQMATRS